MKVATSKQRLTAMLAASLTMIYAAPGQTTTPPPSPPLPTAQAYAKFSWPRQGYLFGDVSGSPVFADPRGDQSELWSKTLRGRAEWVYRQTEKTPHIEVAVTPPGRQEYLANAVLEGYDHEGNAYVRVKEDATNKGALFCEVDPAGAVKIVPQIPGGLWKPGSDTPVPLFAKTSGQKSSATKGRILGDERVDIDQKISLSQGKVSWTYNNPDSEPDEIRVVLLKANGDVRSPHADLKGFDKDWNAYVQIDSDITEFNRLYYRIDADGLPTRIDALPKDLWSPTSPPQEVKSAPPPAAPTGPVEKLPNGKYKVHFTDPDSNKPASAEMEQLAASKNPDSPDDGVYHNDKYMITIRGGDIRVSPNRIPMGFMKRERPNN